MLRYVCSFWVSGGWGLGGEGCTWEEARRGHNQILVKDLDKISLTSTPPSTNRATH
jgi:hypothetical protein